MNSVLESKNYDKFEQHIYNRNIRKIQPLTASMEKYGFLSSKPITVIRNGNGRMKIVDGHHRFSAAKSLGIPVKYVVENDNIDLVDIINAERPWALGDFSNTFVLREIPDYIELQDYCQKTGICQYVSIMVLAGKVSCERAMIEAFKRGQFKVTSRGPAQKVADIITSLKSLGIKYASDRWFVFAVSKCIKVPGFDISTFKEKAKAHKHLFDKQPDIKHYIDMIDRIYNRHNRSKIPVSFLAK